MKTIPLSGRKGIGKECSVSDCDFEYLSKFKWFINNLGYVVRQLKRDGKWTMLAMHRDIMKPEGRLQVDHINGDRIDNRRENLRVCTQYQNLLNRKKSTLNTSGISGLTFIKSTNRWFSKVKYRDANNRVTYKGKRFKDREEAIEWLKLTKIELHGEYARL